MSEFCGPCYDAGRGQVVAHYASDKRTGTPARCWHCKWGRKHPLDEKKDLERQEPELASDADDVNVEEEREESNDRADRSPAPEVKTMGNDEVRKCSRPGCEVELGPGNTTGRCAKHYYVPKSAKPAGAENGKAVAGGGKSKFCNCGLKLHANNKSGVCENCKVNRRPWAKDAEAKAKKNGHAKAETPVNTVTLEVTEGFVNQWWSLLTLKEKAALMMKVDQI